MLGVGVLNSGGRGLISDPKDPKPGLLTSNTPSKKVVSTCTEVGDFGGAIPAPRWVILWEQKPTHTSPLMPNQVSIEVFSVKSHRDQYHTGQEFLAWVVIKPGLWTCIGPVDQPQPAWGARDMSGLSLPLQS